MKKCPACAEEIQDKAIKCKHCGKSLKKSNWLGWLIGILIVLYMIGSKSNDQSTNTVQAQADTTPKKEVVHTITDPAQRFGQFHAKPQEIVSLNGFRVFGNPKPNVYFIRIKGISSEQKPKILTYRGGALADGYEFASQDIATYVGKMEYKSWDTETNELYDVYSLQ